MGKRITPAHAGKRRGSKRPRRGSRDHPRACGEKYTVSVYARGYGGSPPRMRGKGVVRRETPPIVGITPAHAGKSLPCWFSAQQYQDHPRACGEKVCRPAACAPAMGSPPRMRGKVQAQQQRQPPSRITPAHAGKRTSRGPNTQSRQDHPRACGEKLVSCDTIAYRKGSPPRMRGKAGGRKEWYLTNRITPAHAGKRV